MKKVKCYGRAKFTVVDSSFKRNFFGSIDSENSARNTSSQGFQPKGSSSFTSVASADYTNIHSRELFTSDTDLSERSLSTYSPCNATNQRRNCKSKQPVKSKACYLRKFSYASTSLSSLDFPPELISKVKKPAKKQKASKSYIKGKTSKPCKTTAKVKTSCSSRTSLKLNSTKGRSKNVTRFKSYKKGALKKYSNTSRHNSLKTHSSIPIQPSCSKFCENPSAVIYTGRKKPCKKGTGKKKLQINRDRKVSAENCSNVGLFPSFSSKRDSFWAAIQPHWSSINEYSFEVEKVSNKKKIEIPLFVEQDISKSAAFADLDDEDNILVPNEGSIDGEIPVKSKRSSSHRCPPAVEKRKSTGEPHVARNNSFSNIGTILNINFVEAIDSEIKTVKNNSENAIVCEKSATVTHTNSSSGQTFSKVENVKVHPIVSEKLIVNEILSTNTDENASRYKNVETCQKEAESKSSDKAISVPLPNLSANIIFSESENSFERDEENTSLSKNSDQFQELASVEQPVKSKGFCSSTPFTSPSTHITIGKKFPSSRVFSPVLQKGLFITSTPAQTLKPRQNQLCNVSRISLGRQLLHSSTNSVVSLQRYPSTKINSPILSMRKKNTLFNNSSSHSNQNLHNRTFRSCISFSRREVTLGDSSSLNEASSIPSTSGENDFDSVLSRLLDFCGQTQIIPFSELYNWSHTTVRKIGEGTYGEVFTLVQNRISSVIKVVPFSAENVDHSMQSVESVLSEVTVSKCLSELRNNKNYKTRNFNKLKSVHLVRGYYPDQMLVAWDKFSDVKSTYNSRPDVFDEQQMFAIIELEYGGKDMSCFILRNAVEAESVLKQIAISLAIAEETHLFEHRDLHLGNILVQRNASKTISYVLNGRAYTIPNHGLVVTIIDFTLSRVLHEGCIFFNDLADEYSLFEQSGEFQFQIYKDTRKLLNNEWHKCLLYSNVLWLTYLCVKLLECNYSRPSSKKHEEGLNDIRTFQNNLRMCQNAFECLTTCNIFPSVPKHTRSSARKMAKKAKLIDRKSLQKSSSHRISSIL